MPGADDTLNAGGPWDALEQLCTCGHTRGEHHTLDENCTVPICGCESFQADETPGQQDDPLTDAQERARREFLKGLSVGDGDVSGGIADTLAAAHADALDKQLADLTDDLPEEGRIGEIKSELDQILDAALLCSDGGCGHRRDLHNNPDGCCKIKGCECPVFLEPKSTDEEQFVDAQRERKRADQFTAPQFRDARDGAAMGTLDQPGETLEVPSFLRAGARSTRSNTREAADVWSNDALAASMDRDPMSPTEGMSDEQRAESDAVQAETLDNLCECGHRYGNHASGYGELCLLDECECVKFAALLKPVAETDTLLPDDVRPTPEQVERVLGERVLGDFVESVPLDTEALRRVARRPPLPQAGNLASNPFRRTTCLKCGHEADQHCGQRACCVEGCDCQALVEYTGGAYVVPEGADIIENAEGHRIPNPGGKLDPKRHTFAHDENIGPAPEDIVDATGRKPYAVRSSRCAGCGHEKIDHDHTEPHACLGSICECPAFVEDTGAIDREALERDRRLPYTPPLLRKKYIGEEELRKILVDAGRLDLLQQLPEVDRVTVNYGAEHWQEIERLALTPQGSSEAPRPYGEKTITAIATALVELRQCLGASIEPAQMLSVIERNAVAIQKTVDALDLIVKRATGEEP